MRCKNCGWDNPAGNAKCVKCNAVLELFAAVSSDTVPEGFNPNKTARGCPFPDCGYPLRPTDSACPNCGRKISESPDQQQAKPPPPPVPQPMQPAPQPMQPVQPMQPLQPQKQEQQQQQQPEVKKPKPAPNPMKGTIIQGVRKLVGFLVTYSQTASGEYFPVYEGKNSIGRNNSNDVVIDDDAVSGEHLVLAYYPQNNKFYFDTVGLTQNGTYLNDKFFVRGGDELVDSDVLTVGSTKLLLIVIPPKAFQ